MNMRYLITGIAGFVGSSLARSILAKHSHTHITGVDDLSFGYINRISDIKDKIRFLKGDVKELKGLLGKEKFDVIVHCAAVAPLPECQKNSVNALIQNVVLCAAVFDYSINSGSRNIIFFSSGAVYEGTAIFPTSEDVPIKTRLVYPTSKYLGEIFFESMCRSYNLNVTAIRLMNLYGPRQDYFRKQPPLIGYLILCLLKKQRAILYSSGAQMRDYIYIDDLLELVIKSGNKMQQRRNDGEYTVVNAGSGESISVNEIITCLEKISKEVLAIERLPAEKYWNRYSELSEGEIVIDSRIIEEEVNKFTKADITKAREVFNWFPAVTMEKGLQECLKYARTIIN